MRNRQRACVGVGLLWLALSVPGLAARGQEGGAAPSAWARRAAPGDVEAWFVKDLYARLLRYDYAARQLAAADAGIPPSPAEFLIVQVRNIRTREAGSDAPGSTDGASAGATIRLTRQTQCHREDPCLVSYRVAWNTPNDPPELAAGEALPAGPVVAATTYAVVVTLGGETRTYTAEVRYHAGDGGALMPEVVDPVLPGLQQLVDDRAPLTVPDWDRHVKTRRYAAVVNRLKGLARAGKAVVPGRSPIGFLPGDDITPQDEQLVMMASGVSCETAQVPTYLRIEIPLYYPSDGPPAPYEAIVGRQVLDQNRQPIRRTMFVDETWNPNPPSTTGDCTAGAVEEGDADSDQNGYFNDWFYVRVSIPSSCEMTSTQSFKVTLDGQVFDIATRYRATWKRDGVNLTCIQGC